MPYISVYIHFVWTTKNFRPVLFEEKTRIKIFQHIRDNASAKDIFIDHLAVQKEHCHCLISLGKEQTMSNVMKLIKGESSHWINKEKLVKGKFRWQNEFFAVSVSPSNLPRVRRYIRNQDVHHGLITFREEYDQLLSHYGFGRFADSDVSPEEDSGIVMPDQPPSEDGEKDA